MRWCARVVVPVSVPVPVLVVDREQRVAARVASGDCVGALVLWALCVALIVKSALLCSCSTACVLR